MKAELEQISRDLTKYNQEVQGKLKFMLNRYSTENWSRLPEVEKITNRIDIYRSLDTNNCGFALTHLDKDTEEINQVEDELGYEQITIFDKWEDVWDLDKTELAVEKYGDQFEIQLEIRFIEWFVHNFYVASVGINSHIQYCLSQNNSQDNFDLKIYNWDVHLDIFNYENNLINHKTGFPSDIELEKRILMKYLGNTIHNLKRTFLSENHKIEYVYDNWILNVKDSRNILVYEIDLQNSENKHGELNQAIAKMVEEIESLLLAEFKEV